MTRAQEAKFWETHDATDYLDEMEPVTVTAGPRPRNRCSVCSQVMLSRYVDIDLAGGRAQLRQLRQLYCPAGHESRLAPEAQRLAEIFHGLSESRPAGASPLLVSGRGATAGERHREQPAPAELSQSRHADRRVCGSAATARKGRGSRRAAGRCAQSLPSPPCLSSRFESSGSGDGA